MTSTASPLIRRVYRYIKTVRWMPKGNKYGSLGPYYPSTGNKKLIPALPNNVQVKYKPPFYQFKFMHGIDGHLFYLAARVSRVIKLERCEYHHPVAVEVQGYVERVRF